MRLNDAAITRPEVIKEKYGNNIRHFLNALLNSEHYSAELLIRNRIIPAGFVKFTVDSGWVFANVSAKLSLGETDHFDELKVAIFDDVDKETPIIESYTEVLYTINEHDVEARLCFMVGSVFPYNGLKMVVPESRFVSLGTSNFPVKKLNEYDQIVNDPVIDEEPGTETNTDEVTGEGADVGTDAGEGIND